MLKKILKRIWVKSQSNDHLLILLSQLYNFFNFNRKKVRGRGNIVNVKGAFLKKVNITVTGDNNKVVISKKSRLTNCNIQLLGSNLTLHIGNDCILLNSKFTCLDKDSEITIGNNTTTLGVEISSLESSKISIGNDCMFSAFIEARTGDSHSIIDVTNNKRINHAKDIVFGNHVWVGTGATILKGTIIEDDSIIGAGSVVTKNVPGGCVAVGNPAKVVKENITWSRELA